jgi:hypothetical protein
MSRRYPEVGRVMLEPDTQPARIIGVVAAADDHRAQGDASAELRQRSS